MPLKALQQQQGITVLLPSQKMMCFCSTASCPVPCLQRSSRAPLAAVQVQLACCDVLKWC